jgi:hypothetical protein
VSPDANNQLEVRTNGVFAKAYNENYLVKVEASDLPDYLGAQITGGSSADGCVTNNVSVVDGQVKVQPSINIQCLLNAIAGDEDFLRLLCQIVDSCKCFLTIQDFASVFSPACPDGYTLVDGICQQIQSVPATPSGTTYNLDPEANIVWSKGGGLIFNAGFNINGSGIGANYPADITAGNVTTAYTSNVWLNGTSNVPFDGSNTVNLGPMNRTAVWSNPYNADTTFVIPINVPVTKTYFIGLGVDNTGSIDITAPNGAITNVLTQNTAGASAYFLGSGTWNFDFWNIYPVQLIAGINFVTVTGHDSGSAFGFGIEIYDNTVAELQAAAFDPAYVSSPGTFPLNQSVYSNLNLLFTSRCARQPGSITANSATCPDNTWTLDTTTGSTPTAPCQAINNPVANWTCKKVLQTPFTGYTATLVWDRISDAINYQVQYKLHTDPDASYIDVPTSPVANPPLPATTVTTTVTGMPTNNFDFRVRANFGSCQSAWAVSLNP